MKKNTLISFLLLLSTSVFAQQNALEPFFKKIEKAYEKGDYKSGFKSNQALISKLSTNNGLDIASAHFLAARGADLSGEFAKYKYHIEMGNKLFKQTDKSNLKLYTKSLIYAVDAYISYGDYAHARSYLSEGMTLLEKGTVLDTSQVYELKERVVRVYFNQGFHLKAQAALPEVTDYWKSKLGKYEYVYDTKKARYVRKKLSKQERVLTARKYALLKDLEAEILFQNGDYETASDLAEKNENWIRNNIGKKDIAFVNNQFLQGTFYDEHEEFEEANRFYAHAVKYLLKTKYGRYKSYSREAIEVNEHYISSFSHTRHITKYSKKKRSLEKKGEKILRRRELLLRKSFNLERKEKLVHRQL